MSDDAQEDNVQATAPGTYAWQALAHEVPLETILAAKDTFVFNDVYLRGEQPGEPMATDGFRLLSELREAQAKAQNLFQRREQAFHTWGGKPDRESYWRKVLFGQDGLEVGWRRWDSRVSGALHLLGLLTAGSEAWEQVALASGTAASDEGPDWQAVLEAMQRTGELAERERLLNARSAALQQEAEQARSGVEHKRASAAINAAYWEQVRLTVRTFSTQHEHSNSFVPARLPYHPSAPTASLPAVVRFGSNTVHGAAIRSLARLNQWQAGLEGYAYGHVAECDTLKMTVGLPNSDKAESLWAFLCKGGARMVKAHYALWARWYESGGSSGGFVEVSINQFCTDLGYVKHHKGGFKSERKREAMRLLEGLTSVEMTALYIPPGGSKESPKRLRGPLWSRGLIAEEQDRYNDLFGAAREGTPAQWEPLAFSYAPGPWFSNPDYARYNRAIGKIGAGLLSLSNDIDGWAILIGGYLATLVRANQYRPFRLRVSTVLERTGLAQSKDAQRKSGARQEQFDRALQRLQEVGVLSAWQYAGTDATELDDPDDPAQIAAYYSAEEADWRGRVVELTVPMEQDAARLQQATARALTSGRKRGRPRKAETAA